MTKRDILAFIRGLLGETVLRTVTCEGSEIANAVSDPTPLVHHPQPAQDIPSDESIYGARWWRGA